MNVTNDGKAIIQPRFTPLAVLSNDTRTKYVLDECGKTYTAVNKANHIGVRLQIDGRLILSGNKCDKGLLLDDERFFLVELKGKNYPHAVEQLINTKKWIESKYPDFCFKFFARIVGKSFPKAQTALQKAKIDIQKTFDTELKCCENKMCEQI